MIYTSYFAKIKFIKARNENPKMFVNIARYIPKGLAKEDLFNLVELAPSEALLKMYKNGHITRESYEDVYEKEVNKTLDTGEYGTKLSVLLRTLGKDRDIYLLCYERAGDFCHRHLLAKYLNKRYNLDIKEWYSSEQN